MKSRCGVIIIGAALGLSFVSRAHAADMGLSINVSNEESLSIILGGTDSDTVSVDITPHDANGVFNESSDVTATVVSTVQNGYTLSMTRSSAAMSSTDSGVTATIDELASSENGYTSSTFPANKWGYSLKSGEVFGNYFGIGDGVELQNSSEITNGTTSTLKFGAKANIDMPAGGYSTTINFVAVGKVDSRTYIQDVTSLNCPTNPTIVYDSRDEATYTIQKLADGKCWLLDNLALDLTDPDVQANLTSATTNASNTTLGYLKGTTVRDINTDPNGYYATAGVRNWVEVAGTVSSNSVSEPLIDTRSKDMIGAGGYEAGEYGTYYNYCAASAGSYCYGTRAVFTTSIGNATEDICPKGWRLPVGDSSGEYQALYVAYNSNNANYINALRLPFSGTYSGDTANNQGVSGSFWASTRNNDSSMHRLYINESLVHPQNASTRNYGFSVRCVAKIASLQSVTTSTCPTTPTTVVDSRDGEEYTIQKLADGNCWLLDNLRLDLTDQDVQAVLSSGNTNASDTTLGYLKNGGGTTSDQYATAGVSSVWSGNIYSTPLINAADKDTTGTGGYEAGKYGVYYNYCAASAGSYCYDGANNGGVSSGDAMEDICPKGWRMPTGGSSGEYQALYIAYGSTEADFVNALRTPLAGYSGVAQGTLGAFWSSVRYDNEMMYNLHTGIADVDPATGCGGRGAEDSVRCILK